MRSGSLLTNGNRTAVSNGFDNLSATQVDHDADDRLLTYGSTSYTYNAAGQRVQKTEGAGGTTSYVYGTGLVRFGARDYDPRIGRWTAPDPIGFGGGQANLYAYAGNSPTRFSDPSGMAVPIVFLAGAAIGALGSVYVYYQNTRPCDRSTRGYLAAAAGGFVLGLGIAAGLAWVAAAAELAGATTGATAIAVAAAGPGVGAKAALLGYGLQTVLDSQLEVNSRGAYQALQIGLANGSLMGVFGGLGRAAYFDDGASIALEITTSAVTETAVSGYAGR